MLIDPVVLIVAGVAGLAGAIGVAALAYERRRRAALEEYSLIRGFQFEAERPDGERRFGGVFAPFTQGRSHKWGYTITGRRGGGDAAFTAFEFKWVTGGGKSTTTHRVAGMVWEREDGALPKFSLTPEGWVSRLGQIFGAQDIDFPDSPEFSRAYRLKGGDEEAIRALFTPELRQFLAVTPDQQVAGGGRFLFWWRGGRLPKADELDEWLEQGNHVRRRFFK